MNLIDASSSPAAGSSAEAPFHPFTQARSGFLLLQLLEFDVIRNHGDAYLGPRSPRVRLAPAKLGAQSNHLAHGDERRTAAPRLERGGSLGTSQGDAYGQSRQRSTLPGPDG